MVSASRGWHSARAGQVASTARYVWAVVVAITPVGVESASEPIIARLKERASIPVGWVAVVDNAHCVGFVVFLTTEERAHIMEIRHGE